MSGSIFIVTPFNSGTYISHEQGYNKHLPWLLVYVVKALFTPRLGNRVNISDVS